MATDADTTPTDQQILTDGTPTDQKILADGTPTGQKILTDGTPTGQKILTDGTPTDRQLLSGPLAVSGGTILANRWQLDHCLASGGYGDVWEGVDTLKPRKIAVKILRTDAGNNDPSAIARMRQEAEILKAISHPNIVAVFGFGNSPFGHFLVMEMLDGKAIDQLLVAEGPADSKRVMPIVAQLLGALAVAHDKQIFHRDLKPENIIIIKDEAGTETAKLVDFGIAKATRLLNDNDDGATLVQTRAGGFMGTPRYAAPEQAVGDPCGPNIDLFALGLVIAEWLTGKMRIDGDRHGDVMQQLLSPDELDISDVPYRWREWLGLMIKKNPRRRYQTARQALEQLRKLVVELHQESEFINKGPRPFAPASSSGFAANDGPLELDFDRARKPQMTPHPGSATDPLRASHTSGQLMPAVLGTALERGPQRSTGYRITRVIFLICVGIISFAAFALLILILRGDFNS